MLQHKQVERLSFLLFQLAATGVFLGRAWQHLYWDAPFRAILWDERLMSGLVRRIWGLEWSDFVTDLSIDQRIQTSIQIFGGFYLLCAIAVWLLPRFYRLARPLLIAGGFSLLVLAFLYCKERQFIPVIFLEFTLQWSSPFFVLAICREGQISPAINLWLRIAIALTFSSHGLLALGIFPTPGNFVEMTMNILKLNQSEALIFLKVAGVLDLLLSVLLFFPRRVALSALVYATFWGGATTLARVWAYTTSGLEQIVLQWLHEAAMRVPHVLLPLALALVLWASLRPTETERTT